MSQFDPPQQTQSDFDMTDAPRKESNPAGIVGFILSLLCLTAPLGLLVSLFALTKRPKGFAIAGTIIGLIFTVVLALVGFGFYKAWPEMKNVFEGQADFVAIKAAVAQHQTANNGQVPADLGTLSLSSDVLTDPWGTPWAYEPSEDGTTFTLVSAGPDGQLGTNDDARLPQSTSDQQAFEVIGKAIEEHYKTP